jgi:hypothetical protein
MAAWTLRRHARFAFAAVAAAAAAGFWLDLPATGDFLLTIMIGGAAVLGSAAVVIALAAALRGEPTPELGILVLLFAGGIAMLLGLVEPRLSYFAAGLAVFAAGAACIGERLPEAGAPAKKRRAAT